jgi:Flp pilus assembly protein TadG
MIQIRRRDRGVRFSLLKEESGSGLVEYAVVFIIMMTMLLAIADFSRALYAYHFISNVARDAARYASVRGSTCSADGSCTNSGFYSASGTSGPTTTTDIKDFVKNVPLGINQANVTCPSCASNALTWPNPSSIPACTSGNANYVAYNAPGCTVLVQVNYTFNFISALVSKKTLTFSATSQEIITH